MYYEKPGGVMHEVIRRAFEELRIHNNAQAAVAIINHVLVNAEGLPLLQSGGDLNATTPSTNPKGAVSRGESVVPRFCDVTSGAVAVSSSGSNPNGYDDDLTRPRLGSSPSVARTTQSISVQWLVAGDISAAMPIPPTAPNPGSIAPLLAGGAELLNKRYFFNRTQILRLLLIRCEAYSIMKQHSRALQDALSAVEISRGQSAEAYFAVGREQHRQLNIVEAVSAFETAEVLLHSMRQAIAGGQYVVDGWIQETASDEDFWAERGYQMSEVRELGITRREFELQERFTCLNGRLDSSGAPSSSLTHSHADQRSQPTSTNAVQGHGLGYEALTTGTTRSGLEVPTPLFGSRDACSLAGEGGAADSTPAAEGEIADFMQVGFFSSELAMWRRLANESRALLAMRQSHTVPSVVLMAANTLLDRRIANFRGGLAISLENNLSKPLRLVGVTAPDGLYLDAFSFPDTIPKAHCGLAMLQPRGWGGYSGCVCYEVHEHLSCFFYFDCPLLGSLKCGVRFVEHRASDLRRAFAEMYKETGVYGTDGGTTASVVAPPPPPPAHTNNASGYDGPGPGGSLKMRGVTTPLTTTVANMNAARNTIRIPPSGAWMTSHAAVSTARHLIKATCRFNGTQSIAFSLSEMLSVRLRSVELAPALEYVGAATLKKLSAVSHRYRELVNNLPPPMFYGAGRRSYPDYCVASDRFSSPWIVRDAQPVTWRLVFEGRLADQEEFSICADSDTQKRILCFSVDAQTKVTGYVYFGDKRCLLYIIKESWIPFSNTLYICTPSGRTLASCAATNNQTQFTMSLTSSSSSSSSSGGGGGGVRGGVTKGGDDVLYSAHKLMPRTCDTSAPPGRLGVTSGASVSTVTGVLIGDGAKDFKSRGSQTTGALGAAASGVVVGIMDGVNDGGGGPTGCAISSGAQLTSAMKSSGGSGVPGEKVFPTTGVGVSKATPCTPTPAFPHSFGQPSSEMALNGTAAAVSMATGRPVHYSIWRSQRVSGGAVGGSATPATTNSGADMVAEIKVIPVLYGMVVKGYCAAEIKLYTGADAMLVSLMSFLMTRW